MEFMTGDEAAPAIVAQTANLLLYGAPGTKKTTNACQAFTVNGVCRAMYAACEPGGLKSIIARGFPLPTMAKNPDSSPRLITTYQDLVDVCVFAGNNRHLFDAVIVDTITAWNAAIVQASGAMQPKAGRNGFAVWETIKQHLFDIRTGCRALGLHIIYLAHDTNPEVDEGGQFWPGCPTLQPKKAVKAFAGGIDTILRVGTVKVGLESKHVYFTGGQEWPSALGLPPADLNSWYCKNRDGVNLAAVPADLKAYLRMRQPPYAGL